MARTSSPTFRLHLLGAFRLERVGAPNSEPEIISLKTRKDASLLAYLALNPQEHPREKLATLLWGDSTDQAARRSLRVALTKLRSNLGADALLGDYATVQLNPALALWVDVKEISDSQTIQPPQIENQQSKIESYSDLLPDFYDDWILEAREQLRAKVIANALAMVQEARGASDYARAIEVAQKILVLDRANETAHQHLIFCYVVTGKRGAALEQYTACEQILRDELAVEPSAETRALAAWIRQTQGTRSPAGEITNLPIPLSSFVGRRREVKELQELLSAPHTRVLSLVGPGGSGKTRLAIQVGTERVGSYPDGVWWVELAALSDPALVLQAASRALGVMETSGEPLRETLLKYLRERTLLLLLDNCEHVIDACAQLVQEILSQCARVKIVTTSREPLNLYGEVVWSVPTLGAPRMVELSLPALLMEYEAVRLFVERAHTVNAAFALTEHNVAAVAQICRRLDGIPLALELAAARVRTLSAEQIAARLDDRFQLLTGGARTALPRQQTLRALIDWSYDLLHADEQQCFAELSVFAGGWTLQAAEQVTSISNAAADYLSRLVDKSLVVADTRAAEPRYTMLETIREYARMRLRASGDEALVRHAHFDAFLKQAQTAAPQFIAAEQKKALDAMELELDNVRAALEWAYETSHSTEALELTAALSDFWIRRSHFAEGVQLFQRGVAATENDGNTWARGRAYSSMATLAGLQGDLQQAIVWQEQALAIYRAMDDTKGIAYALHTLGIQYVRRGDHVSAHKYYAESLALARQMQDMRLTAFTLNSIGHLEFVDGDSNRAVEMIQESLALVRAQGDEHAVAIRLHNLGEVELYRGEYARAEGYIQECLALVTRLDYKWGILGTFMLRGILRYKQARIPEALELFHRTLHLSDELNARDVLTESLEMIGACSALIGQAAQGAQLQGAAGVIRKQIGLSRFPPEQVMYENAVRMLQTTLGAERYTVEYAAGETFTLAQAMERAFGTFFQETTISSRE